jgi:cytochrome c
MIRYMLAAGLLLTAPALVRPAQAQDAEAGKAIFKSICNLCHENIKNKNRVGPSLYGVVGRHSGIIPGFAYSDANKNSGITWTEDVLFKYEEDPQKMVPGTKMTYTGLKDPQKRKDLIAYLKTLHD